MKRNEETRMPIMYENEEGKDKEGSVEGDEEEEEEHEGKAALTC